jgi:hypothetical protein
MKPGPKSGYMRVSSGSSTAAPDGRLNLEFIVEDVAIWFRRNPVLECEVVLGRLRGPAGVGLPGIVSNTESRYLGGTGRPGAFGGVSPTCGDLFGNRCGYFRYKARIASMLGNVFADKVVPTRRGDVFGWFCVADSGTKVCVEGMDVLSILCARAVRDGCGALEV